VLAVPHRRSCATASQPESPRPLWPAPQQPLEINDELLSFVAVQMNIDSERISDYASWQHTVSEHQARVQQYLGLRPHALARDIYYGRRGRINALELHEQMNSCSCLTLLLACVVYWQAKEISRVLKMGIPEGEDINISLLEHVSPIEWENVILYGQYVLNPDDIR